MRVLLKKGANAFATAGAPAWKGARRGRIGLVRLAIAGALLAASARAQPHRGGVLHFAAYQAGGTIDPQINYVTDVWQVLSVTQDQLLAFRKAEGADGLVLVPDLAESLPEIRDDGRTYVFRLRQGVRFSDGREVGVADVVASFRRIFRVSGPNAESWYSVIVGGPACLAHPAGCTLDGGVVGDAASRTVTIHLTRPDSEFAQKIALPFAAILPADTPGHDLGTIPPLATGPYRVASYNPLRAMVLERNPYFHEWSAAAQPDGYADRIEIRYGLQTESEVSAIEHGDLDWMSDPPPLDRLAEIGSHYARLAHIHPMLGYYYLMMNTHLPPFDDPRARRAVALAVNRRVLVNLYGGPALGTPLVPPAAGRPGRLGAVLSVHRESGHYVDGARPGARPRAGGRLRHKGDARHADRVGPRRGAQHGRVSAERSGRYRLRCAPARDFLQHTRHVSVELEQPRADRPGQLVPGLPGRVGLPAGAVLVWRIFIPARTLPSI